VSHRSRAFGLVAAAAFSLSIPQTMAYDRPVADAAARGDIATVRDLLRDGVDVNDAQGDGMTALHWAAERGDSTRAPTWTRARESVTTPPFTSRVEKDTRRS
jgi:hypothetical protein